LFKLEIIFRDEFQALGKEI